MSILNSIRYLLYLMFKKVRYISRNIPRELHAPIKNNEKWREHTKFCKKGFSLKILQKGILKGGKIIHHYSCYLAKKFGKMVYLSQKQSVAFSKAC